MNFNKNNTYFTSDCHYGHENIIKHCNRPFTDVEHMNTVLIDNHNRVVRPNDNVINLGDFAFRGNSADTYLKKLNGNIWFVLGNHDKDLIKFFGDSVKKDINGKIYRILPAETVINIDKQYIVLSHYAMRSWYQSHRGTWMFYGHSHGSLPNDINSLSLDIGVDCNNYFPFTFEQIQQHMNKKQFKPFNN